MGVMTCTKVRSLKQAPMRIEKYNYEAKEKEIVSGFGYPDLVGKKVGLLLQKVLDSYKGKDTEKMELFGVFEAGTGFTATEILDKAMKPVATDLRLEQLMKYPVKDKRQKFEQVKVSAHQYDNSSSLSDEIPF
jgi:hypothetical protein